MPLPFRSLTADHTDHNDSHLIIAGVTVLLSVLIHTGIGVAAGDARLDFFSPKTVHPEAWREGLRDEPVRARIVQPPPTQEQFAETVERADLEPRERPPEEDPVTLLAAADTEAPATLFEPPPTAQGIGEAMSAGISPPATPDVADSVTPWTPRETVLEIASRFANDDLAAIARKEVPSIERVSNAPDIAPPQTVSVTLEGRGDSLIAKYAMPQPGRGEMAVPAAMLEVTPAEEPESLPLEPISHEEEVSRFIAEAPEDVAPATPIENVLAPSIQVYRPARDDGYVYFRVDIRRKGADVLPPIPRDILFVQDASASLSAQRLHYCNLAIQQILDSDIRPTDRINVLAFNTTNSYAFGKAWAPATPKNIEIAKAFTQNIRAAGNTDIFNAVKSVLELPRDPARATIVFVLTDGVATAGDIRRDSEIIGEFSRLNDGSLSVFNIGVSPKSDRYLLSMLSFCNRGGQAAISSDRFSIPNTFKALYETTGSPVLSDIHFTFDTYSNAIITPVMTENLYLDRPFSLWGRAPVGTREIVFQARGINGKKKYDMVYSLDLGEPARGSGDRQIAYDWALVRMYDLVAAYARQENSAYLREMNDLGKYYDIPLPFGRRFSFR